jgi:hypothetical protein
VGALSREAAPLPGVPTSLVTGPVVGLAADRCRLGGRAAAALGAGVPGGMLGGEAVWGSTGLKFSRMPHYWHVQHLLGVALAVGLTQWRSRGGLLGGVPDLAASLAAGAVAGLATLAVFHVVGP